MSEHMPSAHRRHAAWTPERIRRDASRVGANTEPLIELIMQSKGIIYGNIQITLDHEAARFRLQSSSDSGVPPCSTALDHRLHKAIWRHGHAHILFQIAFV